MILVLLGHSFPDGDMGPVFFSAKWIRTWVYLFHMGIFFIISGFVMSTCLYSGEFNLKDEITKKIHRLLVPYFFYSLLTLLPKLILAKYANNPVNIESLWTVFLGNSPNGGMWFLWHLFFISVVFLGVMKFVSKRSDRIKTITLVLIGLVSYFLYEIGKTGYLNYSCKFALFFVIGIIMNKNYVYCQKMFKPIPAIIAIVFNIVIACPFIKVRIPYIVTGVIGFYGMFTIGLYVSRHTTVIKQILDYLGTNSYGIYLLSYFAQIPLRILLYSRMHLQYWVCVIAMFIGGLLLPMMGIYIIRKNKILRVIALGETWTRK